MIGAVENQTSHIILNYYIWANEIKLGELEQWAYVQTVVYRHTSPGWENSNGSHTYAWVWRDHQCNTDSGEEGITKLITI